MRMWMVDPRIMCTKHLLGEHVELHMFAAHFRLKRYIAEYVDHNCVSPKRLISRHKALVKEMKQRKFKHQSEIEGFSISYLPSEQRNAVVDSKKSEKDLLGRCIECRARKKELIG